MARKRKNLKIKEEIFWYLAGLITSDGNLSSDGRHIDITSTNYEFLQEIKNLIGIKNKIGIKYGGKKQKSFRIQIANKNFYTKLLTIGLTPNKSLTLRDIAVQDIYFYDFLRGVIDGDGGIQRWIHNTNKMEQWNLRIASGSRKFLEWLQSIVENNIGAKGKLHTEGQNQFRLKYGKMAAQVIVQKCYYPRCFGLQRKMTLAKNCLTSYKGWDRSKTVVCGNNENAAGMLELVDNTDLKSVGA